MDYDLSKRPFIRDNHFPNSNEYEAFLKGLHAEITKKRDVELSLFRKGHLPLISQEVARVLILRYNEILGESFTFFADTPQRRRYDGR